MQPLIISTVTAALPIAALLFSSFIVRKLRRSRFKTPLTAKLLRPPGESLRLKIENFAEKLNDGSVLFVMVCGAVGFGTWRILSDQSAGEPAVLIGLLVIGYAVCVISGLKLFYVRRLMCDYELGFLGERAVGEELNRMMARGYEVFHDVPFEGRPGSKDFNIDHVAVGPGGVYAVETKTRRKQPKKDRGMPRNVVEFDGAQLIFPWGRDDFGIKQARLNAGALGAWLRKAVGAEIDVIPILALPGWSVERKGRGDVRVVSGREICSVFPKAGINRALSDNQIKQIAFQLEQRCRDVEVE